MSFEDDGFLITGPLLEAEACDELGRALEALPRHGAGSRNLLELEWCRSLAALLRREPCIAALLPADAVAVQCTYFEKSQHNNWLVPLHQDLSIPVRERVAHPELSGWSEKEGNLFVQPPAPVLKELIALRLHIDDCGSADGPLRVVSQSHRLGRLCAADALALRTQRGELDCPVSKGAALALNPLLLHASSKSEGNSRRRVLHFVFGPTALPFGLAWRHAV